MIANVNDDHHRKRWGCPNTDINTSMVAIKVKRPKIQQMRYDAGAGHTSQDAEASVMNAAVVPPCSPISLVVAPQ